MMGLPSSLLVTLVSVISCLVAEMAGNIVAGNDICVLFVRIAAFLGVKLVHLVELASATWVCELAGAVASDRCSYQSGRVVLKDIDKEGDDMK